MDLVTPEWVAEQLNVKPETIKNWCRQGSLRGVKIGRKIWRIPMREYRRFISEDLDASTSESLNESQSA